MWEPLWGAEGGGGRWIGWLFVITIIATIVFKSVSLILSMHTIHMITLSFSCFSAALKR